MGNNMLQDTFEMVEDMMLGIPKEELEYDDFLVHIACKFILRRSDLGWTRTKAAKEAGISLGTLDRIESGNFSYKISSLWKYAKGLGMQTVVTFIRV